MENQEPYNPNTPVNPQPAKPTGFDPNAYYPELQSQVPAPKGSRPWVVWMLIGIIIVMLGGAYGAHALGNLTIPFLPKPAKTNSNQNTTNTPSTNTSGTSTNATTNTSTIVTITLQPLNAWNSGYTAISTSLNPPPDSIGQGQETCEDEAKGSLSPNFCLSELAVGFRSVELCEELREDPSDVSITTFDEDVRSCYQDLANTYEPFDCASVGSQPNRDICFLTMATSIDQPTMNCSQIEDKQKQDNCRSAIDAFREVADALSVFEAYQLAVCYVARYPAVVDELPANEINEGYREFINEPEIRQACNEFDDQKIEAARGLLLLDADGDGLTVVTENMFGTSDSKADSDGDGVNDLDEFTTPKSKTENSSDITNTVPSTTTSQTDSDGDRLINSIETSQFKTNPQLADSDADGLSDYEEVSGYITNPTQADSDGDGYGDGQEVCRGYNPLGDGTFSSPLPYPPATCPPNLTPTGTRRPVAENPTDLTITNLAATLTGKTVSVTWTTSEPAYSALYFGTTATYSSGHYPNSLHYLKNHSVQFPIEPNQTYHYAVLSCPDDIFYLSECAISADQTIRVP